jgi:hypothetical protein
MNTRTESSVYQSKELLNIGPTTCCLVHLSAIFLLIEIEVKKKEVTLNLIQYEYSSLSSEKSVYV